MDYGQLRREYKKGFLSRETIDNSPFIQFEEWHSQAIHAKIMDPNAFTLATATKEGRPSTRMVLMKGFSQQGLLFFTNCESRKSRELELNPHASLTFFWRELERQVIIEGEASKISRKESERYFATRPQGAKISCWASRQGRLLASREALETAFIQAEEQFKDQEIPLPSYWGGWRLLPHRFEFWQGRDNRLHDRFQYLLVNGHWHIDRLSP